jgi:hypothetical protein
MSEKREQKKLWPGLQDYLSSTVRLHPTMADIGEKVRAVIKWTFDLLRNTLMAGGVYYLGLKSHNWWLLTASLVLAMLLCVYVWSYLDALIIRVLPSREGSIINITFHLFIVLGLSFVSMWGITEIVQQIADANLAKP